MSPSDLCSAVFILRPQTLFPVQRQFRGRMAQKLFLLMLQQAGQQPLAAALHDLNTALPYTVSDLFPNGSQHVWMRVTGLTAGVSAALDDLVRRLPGSTLEVLPSMSAALVRPK